MKFLLFLQLIKQIILAPKKVKKESPKVMGKKTRKKTDLAGIIGIFKDRIHYKDDSIFNLG